MDCVTYQEKISDHIDNLLPALERQHVEDHLSACAYCYTFYQDLVTICEASHNLPECEPSEAVWERILAEISPRQGGMLAPAASGWFAQFFPLKSLKLGAWIWQPALAALLVIGVAAIMYYRFSTQSPGPVAGGNGGWTGPGQVEAQPTYKLIVHKPRIEVALVQQRIDELQKHIQTVQSRWSPEVQALYQHQLEIVDRCLNNCRGEFSPQEDDSAVRAVYQSALRAKLEMLKQFSDL